MPEHGIRYVLMPELGGLRKPRADSINTGWRNVGFRGYADYMQTEEFWNAIDRLRALPPVPPGGEVAIMCAEAVPWRCHRSLISDALTVKGEEVRHIIGLGTPAQHSVTPFARIENGNITYPPPDTLAL